MRTSFSKRALLATTLLSGLAFAGAANAQDPNTAQDPNVQSAPTDQTPATTENVADTPAVDSADAGPSDAEIVVTGSRIASPNIVSLAPVQVVGETEIDQSGAINLQEVLLENPAMGTPLLSTTNSAFLTSGAGTATIDLRNLGSNRTLVLINSRRVVGGLGGSPIVDLNTIPTQFIERVDILTGGASSLYGSDAVAGVVNIIYKRNFEGLLMEGQYGITELGDTPRYQISATAGGNFMDGRGNVMIHLGYSDDKGLLSRDRKNTRVDDLSQFALTRNPDDFFTKVEPFFSGFTPQGRFFAGADQFTFGADGQLLPCFSTNGTTCGGSPNGFNRQFFRTLSTPVERWLFAERAHFDITDNISFITEATYAKTQAATEIEPVPLDSGVIFPTTGGQVPIETLVGGLPVLNPLVPAAIAAAATDYDGDGLRDIFFTRRLSEFGTRNYTADRDFFRIVAGFEGKLFGDKFSWDLTYNFGRTDEVQKANGDVNVLNFANALQAIPDTADVDGDGNTTEAICASAAARAQGCVPVSLFGVGSVTPAALAYIAAETNHSFKVTQQVFAGNLSGSLLELPAGPLGVAVGAEYRKEQSEENWDSLTNAGLVSGNALPDTAGEFNVKEVYGEVNVPVLADMPFAHALNLRAAGRLSDYSTVGSVKTWSLGADYSPIEAVRFRGTLATAVRAPNIGELFTGPSQTFPTGLIDPCDGIGPTGGGTTGDNCRAAPGVAANIAANGVFTLTQADIQGISGFTSGNPNLGAETAKSFTVGVVIAPRSIPALRNVVLSVDYFHIKVDDAVTFTDRQTVLDQCYVQGNPAFCQFIIRRPAQSGPNNSGSLEFINIGGVNAAALKTSGIDAVLAYRTSLDQFLGGLNMNARIAYTRMLKGYIVELPGAAKNRYVGEVGAPKDKANGSISFDTDKWGLTFQGTYIGESNGENDALLESLGLPIDAIRIPAEFYLDSQIRFTPSKTYEFFVGVDNLLDNKAPNILSGTTFNNTGSDTNAGTYDIFGRRYYAGARLRF